MLQSFIGTCDSFGLRSLRIEDPLVSAERENDRAVVRFWAILDSAQIPSIQHAVMLGNRDAALELVASSARSFGRVDDR